VPHLNKFDLTKNPFIRGFLTEMATINLLELLHSHIYTVERGKLTAEDVTITESGILKPEEERIVTVSVPSLVSLYFISFLLIFQF